MSDQPKPPARPGAAKDGSIQVDAGGRSVRLSSPDKVIFPQLGVTKAELAEYYLAVADGAVNAVRSRPTVMKRFPRGIDEDSFFQKRVPANRPDWLNSATIMFPSGRSAEELCPTDVAHLIWAVNLGCIDFNPWPTRKWDPDHADELRIDLDPQPGVPWSTVRRVAEAVHELLDELGMVSWPKTSGSRGIHINVRIVPKWGFDQVRLCALSLAREIARRLPDDATAEWFKKNRGDRVLIDYNQNARDRTVASAYSVRPVPGAWVSAPIRWDELADAELGDFTIRTMPARYAQLGDLHADMDDHPAKLDGLMEMVARDQAAGLDEGALPPMFPKKPAGEETDKRPGKAPPEGASTE